MEITATYQLTPVEFDPFAGPELLLLAPATEAQMEIWLACKIGGAEANCAYNESFSLKLSGALNIACFENALKLLVARHESLRTLFSPDGSTMCIYADLPPGYSFEDVTDKPVKLRTQAVTDYLYHNSQSAFNLVFGPLFRVKLFKLDEDRYHLTLTLHHIICDGWSFGVILQELGKLYSASAQKINIPLPAAPKFSEYAQEQQQFSQTAGYKESEAYWVNLYKTRTPLLNLPGGKTRPAIRTYASGHFAATLDEQLSDGIKKLAYSTASSVITTLLVAFEVFLQQQTGSDDVVIGVPAARQPVIGMPGLVGHCVSLLPVRSYAPKDMSFTDYLRKRRPEILDAYDHQQLTFGSLLKKINFPRNPSRVPLVPFVFNSDMGMDEGVSFYGLGHELKANARRFENFEIFINVSDIGNSLNLDWSYNAQLFDQAVIEQLELDFEALLQQFSNDAFAPIKKMPSVSVRGDMPDIDSVNATDADYPKEKPLHALVSETAAKYASKTAVASAGKSYTYKQLDERSNQLARLLADKQGIRKGHMIGLAVERSADMLIALLAIMKAGGVYIPVDPEYPADRVQYMLHDSSARLLITSAKHKDHFKEQSSLLVLENALSDCAQFPLFQLDTNVTGNDIAYVLYTSGSTGKPKGVRIAHYNLVNFLTSMRVEPGINEHDNLLAVTTISFDIAGLEMYLPLIAGASVCIASEDDARDGRELLKIIKTQGISLMQATPYSWKMMLEAGWDNYLPIKVLCGGEALPKDLAATLLPRCAELWNMYGPTETTIWSSIKRITADDELITIGKPISNTRIYILDDSLQVLPVGEAGEIYIGGDGVSPGYLNRDELTAERFVPDGIRPGPERRLYRTGDMGKLLANGELQCLGRIDFQVKVRGYRIEVQEIEFAVNQIDSVKDVVVDARNDSTGNTALVAYVIPNGHIPDERAIIQNWRSSLRESLPDYMVPQYFVILDKFPLTPNGKIARKELPEPDYNLLGMGYVAPRTTIEQQVAEIWKRYMGLERVGIYDDFFEIGGHSLIAVEIMTALQKETGKNLPLASLFQHSTVEKLALLLQMDGTAVTWDSLVPIKPLGNKMPLYIVHGAGLNVLLFNTLAINMSPDQPVFGLQAKGLNGIDEPLDRMEDIAEHYVNEIVAQNPNGPYALAGYSFGGIIAFEMAKQLEARGRQVKMLAMFDTYAYKSDYYDFWLKKYFNRVRYLVMQILYSFVLLVKSPRRTFEYKTEMLRRSIVSFYWKLRYGKNQKQVGFSGYAHKIDIYNAEAERNYNLTAYPIRVELFRASEHTFYMDDFEYLGWKKYAQKGVSIHEIPGEHNRIFAPPNDKVFARILQECLDKAAQS